MHRATRAKMQGQKMQRQQKIENDVAVLEPHLKSEGHEVIIALPSKPSLPSR